MAPFVTVSRGSSLIGAVIRTLRGSIRDRASDEHEGTRADTPADVGQHLLSVTFFFSFLFVLVQSP